MKDCRIYRIIKIAKKLGAETRFVTDPEFVPYRVAPYELEYLSYLGIFEHETKLDPRTVTRVECRRINLNRMIEWTSGYEQRSAWLSSDGSRAIFRGVVAAMISTLVISGIYLLRGVIAHWIRHQLR